MTPLRSIVAPVALLMLAGCASMDDRSTSRAAPPRATDASTEYIAQVESVARRRGIQVIWLSPPSKPARRKD